MNEIHILQPIMNPIKEFHTPEEFNIYYNKNKEEIDNTTTHKLNKLYRIDGYRITKIKGELMLKKASRGSSTRTRDDDDQIQQLKDTINKIIQYLNTDHSPTDVVPPSVT